MIPPLSHWAGSAAALVQVVIIDLTMAGDNAVAVGLTAARLPPKQRHRAMVLGLAAAVVMLIGFALVAVQLLKILGLLLAGGLLLLWVCWRMWRELRAHDLARGESAEAQGAAVKPKSTRQALLEILAADLSMSLDNVLGVAGAARDHPIVLVVGLLLSITLTGLAASQIARLFHKAPWIGYVGLAIVLYVAGDMIWHGSLEVARHA